MITKQTVRKESGECARRRRYPAGVIAVLLWTGQRDQRCSRSCTTLEPRSLSRPT